MQSSHTDDYSQSAIADDETPAAALHQPPRTRSTSQPRSILKNGRSQSSSAGSQPGQQPGTNNSQQAGQRPSNVGLQWDETNLTLNEVQRDSTMKITEPKVGRRAGLGLVIHMLKVVFLYTDSLRALQRRDRHRHGPRQSVPGLVSMRFRNRVAA